jgi:hypothetical protein
MLNWMTQEPSCIKLDWIFQELLKEIIKSYIRNLYNTDHNDHHVSSDPHELQFKCFNGNNLQRDEKKLTVIKQEVSHTDT